MASIAFREGGYRMAISDTDYDGALIFVTLLMTNQAVDKDDATLSAMTLDECDSATFTFAHAGDGRKNFASSAVVKDTSGRVDFETGEASTTWASLAAATRSINGALIHEKGAANDTTAYPIAYCEWAAVAANGLDFVVNWDSGSTEDVMRWTFS